MTASCRCCAMPGPASAGMTPISAWTSANAASTWQHCRAHPEGANRSAMRRLLVRTRASAFNEELGLGLALQHDVEAVPTPGVGLLLDGDQARPCGQVLDAVEDRVDVIQRLAGEIHL